MTKEMNRVATPLLVGFVADLMFSTRIENVSRHLGYRLTWIENAAEMGEAGSFGESPGEQLHGRTGTLFQKITAWQPALLLFDLSNEAIPWQKWIPALKTAAATRRIPILCFGPHVDVGRMREARRLGADAVLARSRFTANMPALLRQYARTPNQAAIDTACRQPLPALARRGINLFNQGQFYACHDDLEEAWRQDETPGRDLYRGILQVGIALFQIQKGNYRGAIKMFLRVRQWLTPLPAICRGVRVDLLRENVEVIYTAVESLGPGRLDQFDWKLINPIQTDPPSPE